MPREEVKFYFYTVEARQPDQQVVDFEQAFKDFDPNTIDGIEVTSGAQKELVNNLQLNKLKKNFWGGKIIRTKAPLNYFKKQRTTITDLKVDGNERIGEKERDIVRFVIRPEGKKLIVLMEVGFQTPGMGVFTSFVKDILHSSSVTYAPMATEKVKVMLKLLENKPVKKVKLRFKKEPDIPPGMKVIEDTFKHLIPDSYTLTIELRGPTVRKEAETERQSFGQLTSRLFGPSQEELSKIDLPAFLSNFKVTTYGTIGDPSLDEDLLDKYYDVKITIDKMALGDDGNKLYTQLCKIFSEKLGLRIDFDDEDRQID